MRLEMKYEKTEQRHYQKENEAYRGKHSVCCGVSVRITAKSTKEEQVLIGQDCQNTQQEANRERRRKSFEHEGP